MVLRDSRKWLRGLYQRYIIVNIRCYIKLARTYIASVCKRQVEASCFLTIQEVEVMKQREWGLSKSRLRQAGEMIA